MADKKKEQLYIKDAVLYVTGYVGDEEALAYVNGSAAAAKTAEAEEETEQAPLSEAELLLQKKPKKERRTRKTEEKTDFQKRQEAERRSRIREKLKSRFSKSYLEKAKEKLKPLSIRPAEKALKDTKSVYFPIEEGGVLASLYQLAQEYKCGMQVDLKKVPVHQETIEICELFGKNPYTASSEGCLLIATLESDTVLPLLEEAGVPVTKIGVVNQSNQKILKIDERIQYLRRPEKRAEGPEEQAEAAEQRAEGEEEQK